MILSLCTNCTQWRLLGQPTMSMWSCYKLQGFTLSLSSEADAMSAICMQCSCTMRYTLSCLCMYCTGHHKSVKSMHYSLSGTYKGRSESSAPYFTTLAHDVRGQCLWFGNRGLTFPPIVCKFCQYDCPSAANCWIMKFCHYPTVSSGGAVWQNGV